MRPNAIPFYTLPAPSRSPQGASSQQLVGGGSPGPSPRGRPPLCPACLTKVHPSMYSHMPSPPIQPSMFCHMPALSNSAQHGRPCSKRSAANLQFLSGIRCSAHDAHGIFQDGRVHYCTMVNVCTRNLPHPCNPFIVSISLLVSEKLCEHYPVCGAFWASKCFMILPSIYHGGCSRPGPDPGGGGGGYRPQNGCTEQ